MASESGNSTEVTITLPADLDAWLDQQAAELGIDREAVLVQLLASYRTAEELGDETLVDSDTVEPAVRSVVADRLPDIAEAVEDRSDTGGVEDFEQQLTEVRADFQDKIDDVRNRVIQVKHEADSKAPDEHTHEEIEAITDRLDALEARVERVDGELDRLADLETELDGVESRIADHHDRLDDAATEDSVTDIADRLADAEEKLQTVAWVVRDLREKYGPGGSTSVDAIKRAAAEHDTRRARCENCGEGVDIGLLTESSCPHCDAALDGFEPSGRLLGLGSASLTVAPQIEAGAEESGDEIDDISTDTPGGNR